jgi:spore germination cell wall hydrolase CwlJ-like protein
MSLFLKRASAVSMAATFLMMVFSVAGSGAAAQEKILNQANPAPTDVLPQPSAPAAVDADNGVVPPVDSATANPASLAELVASQPQVEEVSDELNCLAGAIYFEARNESLAGQLAVGRVIVARTRSGRFPTSYCGVVYQPAQFSFVHSHSMPAVNTASRTWRNAVAIAAIAHKGAWNSPAEGALFFHAARVSPHWGNRVRVAQIENHIFYR